MKTLLIDIETFSSVDIAKCGAYKYIESEDFDVLLFSYSVDDAPAVVIDIACGEEIPDDIVKAMYDPDVLKLAHNMVFEITALSKYFGKSLPVEQWQDTMALASYLGLPLGLDQVGKVLNLSEKKDSAGKRLIRLFSCPNSKGNRVYPNDKPEQWQSFRDYCRQDVDTETELYKKVRNRVVIPQWERELQIADFKINRRGVRVDVPFARNAVDMWERVSTDMLTELKELTGLENPNSQVQMKAWLNDNGFVLQSLDKVTVAEALKNRTMTKRIRRALELRQTLAKTSVKKYEAMLDYACSDNRAHGITQYYGATTGRWAGRGVQTQNLPQNHFGSPEFPDELDFARGLVADNDYDSMQMCYPMTSDALSQLIRTALIPSDGNKFIVCDFSAIEARVLAWLAGEQKTLEAFRNGDDIYCHTASMMFNVPVGKKGPNAELRQKGKVATLACIAEGQLVETDKGPVPIEKVTTDMKVWDGDSFVKHDGVIYKGIKDVIEYEGLTATTDHLVFIEGGKRPIRFGDAASSGSHLLQSQYSREGLWTCANNFSRKKMDERLGQMYGLNTMQGMWIDTMDQSIQSDSGIVKGMSILLSTEADTFVARPTTDSTKATVREPKRPAVQELRSPRYKVQLQVCDRCGAVYITAVPKHRQKVRNRQDRQQRKLRAGEHSSCYAQTEYRKSENNSTFCFRTEILAICGNRSQEETGTRVHTRGYNRTSSCSGQGEKKMLATYKGKTRVYDILNAGPHHRYAVSGKIVHNCGYAGGVGALRAMGGDRMGLSEQEMKSIVRMWRNANPNIVKFWDSVERAALGTIITGESHSVNGLVTFSKHFGFLFATLPSGRSIAYPRVRIADTDFGQQMEYERTNQVTRKWERTRTFSGKIVENIVQAVARDILANVILKCESKGYNIVFHVHDEVIIDAPPEVTLEDVEKIFSESPEWAKGLPLKGAGYTGNYYFKD